MYSPYPYITLSVHTSTYTHMSEYPTPGFIIGDFGFGDSTST